MWMTMSSSAAPARMASRVSNTLAPVVAAPRGKPTTAMGFTPLPCKSRAQSPTLDEFTHTVANP